MIYPLPLHADRRRANISDGFSTEADVKAGRATRQHRGADLMYWIPRLSPARGKANHPYSTGIYEIPRPHRHGGYDVPVLALETGRVVAATHLSTGWWVALELGQGVGVAYHHLDGVLVLPDAYVGAGTPLGFVGGSPVGYGLWHLHFDYATGCRFGARELAQGRLTGTYRDPAPYLAKARHVTLMEAWGEVGRVS